MKGEVMGLIATDEGNFNLVWDPSSGKYILYNDKNLKEKLMFECEVEGDKRFRYNANVLQRTSKTAIQSEHNCVRFYFETEHDIFQARESVEGVEGFITGLYNQVALLYQNENIETAISEIHVWTTPDPYTATNTQDLLNQFRAETTAINGDLGHLLTFRPVGGGRAAGYDGICNSDVNARLAVSRLNNNYQLVPNYSWSVLVVTHEFGHLMGSRHTHACVWNGNNTAIDGCHNCQEHPDPTNGSCNNCPQPPTPSGGGTIMSYCHTSDNPGINFNLGFGLQPGNVIRNSVHNATCLCECFSGSISGSSLLCSSSVYSLSSVLPSGASVTWTASPAGAVNITGSGTSRTLTPVGNFNGHVTLKATVTGLCEDMEIRRFIWVGPPSDMLIAAASHWGPPAQRRIDPSTTTFAEAAYDTVNVNRGNYHLLVHGLQEYEWEIWDHSNWNISPQWGGGPPDNADVEIDYWHSPQPAQQRIYIRARNACGWGWWRETYWDVIGGCSFCAFTVYPNPASETIYIRLDSEKEKVSMVQSEHYTIEIYNENGDIVWEKETDSKEESISTTGWKQGVYYVRIHHPEGEFAQRVVVRR
ncbi:zinc-dependent metalloprotease [Negadavirga shengliensis]|uniref:Zinc-dependent metalloprotease n=1 Tax=Negadavirga shengliensis TaxID=1389218 RepID=A0ABV9T2N9_9BACT